MSMWGLCPKENAGGAQHPARLWGMRESSPKTASPLPSPRGKERWGGGEKIIWDKRIVPIVPASSPVMARMTLCWAQCLRAGGGPRPPWGIRRFIVSVQWSEKLQAPPVILCYFLAPDMMRPCLDPSLLSCCQVTTGKGERSTLENVPGVYMPER